MLFDLLHQIQKQFRLKEVDDRNAEAVAEFLNGRNRGAVVASADNVVHCGLGHAAANTQGVDGNILLLAQFDNPLPDSLADRNGLHLLSLQYVKKAYTIPLANITPFELK